MSVRAADSRLIRCGALTLCVSALAHAQPVRMTRTSIDQYTPIEAIYTSFDNAQLRQREWSARGGRSDCKKLTTGPCWSIDLQRWRAIGAPARLKWPNDVLLGEQKVCGILVERLATRPAYAVIGIGLNVDQRRDELPVETATSLALAGVPRDRTELFGQVLRELRFALVSLARDPHGAVGQYRGLSATLDRRVRVDLPGGEVLEGTAVDIDDHGALVVAHDEPREPGWAAIGRTTTVGAGDVVHVRPGAARA